MKRLFFGIIFIFLIMAPSRTPHAEVTGVCSNCHTMHNSQAGDSMAYDFDGTSFTRTATPKGNLLIYSCLGCHSATDGTTWKDSTTGAPIVFNTVEPSYNAVKGLAAGNFHWVKTEDTKGHNIFSDNPDTLSPAPGDGGFSTCGTNNCHTNFDQPVSGTGFDLDGRQGCTKCHMVSGSGKTSGYHHADDSATVLNAAPWYRFLSGHMSGDGHGVCGIEHANWNYGAAASSHNEYLGFVNSGGYGFGGLGHTMTAYCTGCHGVFHSDQGGTSSPFLRHPSDIVIKDSGEYANAFGAAGSGTGTYDPLIPVARPSLSAVLNTVTLGTDMVMCLSCHRAHGGPYYKMMRWDYKNWPGGGYDGCGKCHTSKK